MGDSYREELKKAQKNARKARSRRGDTAAQARSTAIQRQQSRAALHYGKAKQTRMKFDA